MDEVIKKIRKFLRNNQLDQYLIKKYFDYVIVAVSLLLGFYLQWATWDIIFFSFVIWIILNPVSSQFLVRMALCSLSLVFLLLILRRNDPAEQFVIFTFYFLVLATIVGIIESRRDQSRKPLGRRESSKTF
jgi:hypothetical protein